MVESFFLGVLALSASGIAILFYAEARRLERGKLARIDEMLRVSARIVRYESLLPVAQSEGRQHLDYALDTIAQEKRYLSGLAYGTTLNPS